MKKSPWNLMAVICASSLGLLCSCSKTGPAGATGARGPAYEGAIAGFVSLFDQYGKPTDVGLGGIQLTLDSVENPLATATTTSTGYYIFPNRFTGLYSLKATSSSTDPAYGSVLGYFQYLTDTLTRNITMSAQANFFPVTVTMTANSTLGSDSVFIGLPSSDVQARQVIVFVGNSPSVSSSNYLYAFTVAVPANKAIVTTIIQASTLHDVGISSGGTVYVAVYGEPVADKSVYASITTGQNVYTALSSSATTASAQVP